MIKDIPLSEFDPSYESVINPETLIKKKPGMPSGCVFTFFYDIIEDFYRKGLLREIAALNSEIGKRPVYEFSVGDKKVGLVHPGIGAPFAAACLEEVIALGCKNIIVCGGAGVLDKNITAGHLVIPISAIRDEGTSFHYLPASREVEPSKEAVEALKNVLASYEMKYLIGKTWTTDAVYRETKNKVSLRKNEGCLTVEMESAALFAVAKFRNVRIAQVLYGGDNLDGEIWDSRDWQNNRSVREKLIRVSAEAVLML